jgi:dienelactone hydrolase
MYLSHLPLPIARFLRLPLLLGLLLLFATGCVMQIVPPTPTVAPPAEITPETTPEATPEYAGVTDYDLGETFLLQPSFPEESRFHKMPVRLNGQIALPAQADGPAPVVVIFHGNHPGCPVPAGDTVDRWPCDPALEQPNYRGFDYLLSRLAAEGYVALSININAENTFGFGEVAAGTRTRQLLDLHLQALRTATDGGDNGFGVELAGRADLQRLALFGHSRGGEMAAWLANHTELAAADAYAQLGYGPVHGLLLIAPAVVSFLPDEAQMPQAILMAVCDQDVVGQDGQYFFEGARMAAGQAEWVLATWLEAAGHNAFNRILRDEAAMRPGRPDCEPMLAPEAQRAFLSDYAADFLTTIFSDSPDAVSAAGARLGLDVREPAPDTQYGLAARVGTLAPAADRQRLFVPFASDELVTHLLGGAVTEAGITTFYCEAGYVTPFVRPGSEPCKRVNFVAPANPEMVVLSWIEPGGAWRFALPAGARDLAGYRAFSLRAALDPTSPLNAPDATQAFSVQLTDGAGRVATVATRPDEPALQFPLGVLEEDEVFAGGIFGTPVPMTTLRLQLADFAEVDLGDIREIALVFDQTPSGSLFMADLEWVRAATP